MATKIIIENNKIIFDGHADDVETCQTVTAICDALNADPAFTTIKYEPGYAEFEQAEGEGSATNLMFAMQSYVLTSRYNDETGYSAAELAAKGSIASRLRDIDDFIAKNWTVVDRLAALENQAKTVLPYTGSELIEKLNKIE